MSPAHRANHFHLLRLTAALAVLLAHGEFLYRLAMPVPFSGHSLGSVAVYCFFFISGYLVYQSWERAPHVGTFWVKRAARIFPGLAVATAFSVFVVGGVMTQLSVADYLGNANTWQHLFNNAAGIATVQVLPGVFENNPFPRTVNGSLWTIRYELLMYLLLPLAGVAGWTRRRWLFPLSALLLAMSWLCTGAELRLRWEHTVPQWAVVFTAQFDWGDVSALGVLFLLGCTFAAYQLRHGPWLLGVAMCGALVAVAADDAWSVQIGVWALVSTGIFWAAHWRAERWGELQADVSYGIYIYAFPLQQAVISVGLQRGWSLWACMALSLGLTLAMATLSWFFVEKPSIRYVSRWLTQSGPAA